MTEPFMADPQRRNPKAGNSLPGDSGRWRLSMSSILVLSFGSLISVSLLLVLGHTMVNATRNTVNLLREQAELGISLITKEIDSHLLSAWNQTAFVSRLLETGRVDVEDRDRLQALMFGAMAADPAIGGLIFLYPDGEAAIVDRWADPVRFSQVQLAADPVVRKALIHGRGNGGPVWVPPTYRPDYGSLHLTNKTITR